MKLTVIESPFAGAVETNLAYVRSAMRHCLLQGESPYASHCIFTQPGVLDDTIPEERKLGIEAGFAWGDAARLWGIRDLSNEFCVAFYVDLGYSRGMTAALAHWRQKSNAPIYTRTLGAPWSDLAPSNARVEGT